MAKMKLTRQEIKAYNHYKHKIKSAQNTEEILFYKRKAQDILAIGKSRVAAGMSLPPKNSNMTGAKRKTT